MDKYFDAATSLQQKADWQRLADDLVQDFSAHVACEVTVTGSSFPLQAGAQGRYNFEIDFYFAINPALDMVCYGILCYTANAPDEVYIGVYLLPFVDNQRMITDHSENVIYIPLHRSGWAKPNIDTGEPGEWSRYVHPDRWRFPEVWRKSVGD